MPAVSAEALLISALVSTASVGQETTYGISVADFEGYRNEYVWLTTYVDQYGEQPSRDIFGHKWPGFLWSEHTNIQSAAQMVHESANRRRLTTAISEAVELMHYGDTAAAWQLVCDAEPRRAVTKPRSLLTDTAHLDEWDQRPYCIELPYPTLQRHTGGIRAGNLWYLAARPGQGKSAHLTSIAKKSVFDGNRVLFNSLEMSESEVRARFHASLAKDLGYPSITLDSLRNWRVDRSEYKRFIAEVTERLQMVQGALDVHTPVDGPLSPSVVAARASEYDLTIIDYAGLMSQDGGGVAIDDWRVMAKISNSLKTIALSAKTGILCAAQINRDGETGSAPPKVKNLAQSDALGQDGDVVLTLRAKPKNVATHFSLEKNRHGASGVAFYTTFDPNTGTYTEISADHAEDLAINAEALESDSPIPKLHIIKTAKDEL